MTYVNEATVLGVSVLFLILGTLAVSARVFVQLKTSRLTSDDWFSFLAWVSGQKARPVFDVNQVWGDLVVTHDGRVRHHDRRWSFQSFSKFDAVLSVGRRKNTYCWSSFYPKSRSRSPQLRWQGPDITGKGTYNIPFCFQQDDSC